MLGNKASIRFVVVYRVVEDGIVERLKRNWWARNERREYHVSLVMTVMTSGQQPYDSLAIDHSKAIHHATGIMTRPRGF
jgi:hypothetical protein